MEPIDSRITEFIKEHHILTLAVSRENIPWCATCFYVYMPVENCFVFTSDDDTRHIKDAVVSGNYNIAGAIALETKMVGRIRGIQFVGIMFKLEANELEKGKKAYLKRFPIARMANLDLWAVIPDEIKMTDNRLGFGKKLIWKNKLPKR